MDRETFLEGKRSCYYMLKLSTFRIAQVAIGILILVVIRTLAELIAITSDPQAQII
jgi:hypothetical protein